MHKFVHFFNTLDKKTAVCHHLYAGDKTAVCVSKYPKIYSDIISYPSRMGYLLP